MCIRLYVVVVVFISFSSILTAQKRIPFDPEKRFHRDSLRNWTISVMQEISIKHPGFYRYTSKSRFDTLIDSTVQTIQDSLTQLEYYRKIKPLFGRIGCLHTSVSLPREYQNYLERKALIPLEVFITNDCKMLVRKNYTQGMPDLSGAELLSINGNASSEILRLLLAAIPADGYNQTEKILLLNYRFAFWYQSMIDDTESFSIEVLKDDKIETHQLKGVDKKVFPSLQSLENNFIKALEFKVEDKVGILTVHSFAKSAMKRSNQNFKKFIRSTFRTLQQQQIKNLILDLRNNSGGTDANAVFLASYFFDKPFRYWEKIEVTEAIANEIKGINRIFFRKPLLKDGTYHWQKTWVTKEFDFYQVQEPAKNPFLGSTFIITNGLCMSSCADFTAILSHNKKALIAGAETGGGFQGNTSGMMPTKVIPSGLLITIPLQKYTNAVDTTVNFGRGSMPHYKVQPTFTDWINQKDVEMESVEKLLDSEN